MTVTEFYVRYSPQGRESGPHDEAKARMLAARALQDPEIEFAELYRVLPSGAKQMAERVER